VFRALPRVSSASCISPHRRRRPIDAAAEKIPADQAWKATPAARKAYLAELRARQARQLADYGWVDEKAGIVRLPIDRAMDLIVGQYRSASSSSQ